MKKRGERTKRAKRGKRETAKIKLSFLIVSSKRVHARNSSSMRESKMFGPSSKRFHPLSSQLRFHMRVQSGANQAPTTIFEVEVLRNARGTQSVEWANQFLKPKKNLLCQWCRRYLAMKLAMVDQR